jgi:hypothetical protein
MKIFRFQNLLEIDDTNEGSMFHLREDQFFLHGSNMINQKTTKEIGDNIVYFKVIKSEGKNIEYMQVLDVLENN